MSVFHEALKQAFTDVDRFLNVTLKDETLSKNAEKEKTKILDTLHKLYEEYEVLNPNVDEGSSTSSKCLTDESRFTTTSSHSHGSHGSEEDSTSSYSDNIPLTTVKALTDPRQIGYLQKKPTEFLEKFSKQKKYCVVHKNIMYWFKKPTDKSQQAAIILLDYQFKDLTQNDKEFIFELSGEKKKSLQFQADTKEDLEGWKKAIETSNEFAREVQSRPKLDEMVMEEEYEDIGELAEAIRRGSANPTPAPSASNAPANAFKLPPLPSKPQPSPPQDIYDEGLSMPAAVNGNNEFIDDDDGEIYEFVESPPSNFDDTDQPATEKDLRSSVPKHLPPRPPLPSPAQEFIEPPPLPTRGANIPVPQSSVPKLPSPVVQKRCPVLDKTSLLEDYENLFYGLWSCVGDSANELSFDRGDIIHILNRDFDGENWWIGENGGNIGLVPKSFLSPAYEIIVA